MALEEAVRPGTGPAAVSILLSVSRLKIFIAGSSVAPSPPRRWHDSAAYNSTRLVATLGWKDAHVDHAGLDNQGMPQQVWCFEPQVLP